MTLQGAKHNFKGNPKDVVTGHSVYTDEWAAKWVSNNDYSIEHQSQETWPGIIVSTDKVVSTDLHTLIHCLQPTLL